MDSLLPALLNNKPFLLLDGAMGTELERLGYHTTLPLWSAMANVQAPVLVKQIHDAYISAGADLITANTFRTAAFTFSKVHKPEMAAHVTRLAIELAKEAIVQSGRDVLLAGSLAPLEDCYRPDLVPSEEVIRTHYPAQIDLLINAGVDIILAETMINRAEVMCVSARLAHLRFPFIISLCVESGCMLDGTPLEEIVPAISEFNPEAILLNCRPCREITDNLTLLRTHFNGIIGAYANGPGHPDPQRGWIVAEGGVEEYCEAALQWIATGAQVVGGCCGTTSDHIGALHTLRETQ